MQCRVRHGMRGVIDGHITMIPEAMGLLEALSEFEGGVFYSFTIGRVSVDYVLVIFCIYSH